MMKKSIVALAALTLAGIASAQSSVTLFGVLDAGVSYYDAKSTLANGASVKQSQWKQSHGSLDVSRIGFKGTEDLGGGLAASFWLEAGLNNSSGAAGGSVGNGTTAVGQQATSSSFFNRRSTVSLSGAFGEVRIGRDYTATFNNDGTFDPFGVGGVGASAIAQAHQNGGGNLTGAFKTDNNYYRASNMIGYFLPSNLGGFYGQVQYALSEGIKTTGSNASKAGGYVGGRFGYANGPVDVALAYGQSTLEDGFAAGTFKAKNANLGASYDLGMVKLMGELSQVKYVGYGTSTKDNGLLIGASVPVGPGEFKASYSVVRESGYYPSVDGYAGKPKANIFALGYVHNLSKRTALYATAAHISNSNGANLTTNNTDGDAGFAATGTPKGANGYDFGIRHSF